MSDASPTDLRRLAEDASRRAYAPYSEFPVGAAVLSVDGSVFTGCNIENASYGLAMCAERVAIFRAIEAGHREIVQLAVYAPTPEVVTPCGACRQVLAEFGRNAEVHAFCLSKDTKSWRMADLLPDWFALE